MVLVTSRQATQEREMFLGCSSMKLRCVKG
jgi:hypothetical protein